MAIKNIVALIREESLQDVVKQLQRANIRGISMLPAKGYGEYMNSFAKDAFNACVRLDIIVDAAQAESVAALIVNAAHSGLEGDGLVFISPIDKLYRVREKKEITGN
jgi:nitrogen regulatory protein P-II 1